MSGMWKTNIHACGHRRPGAEHDVCNMKRGHGGWHTRSSVGHLPTALWPERTEGQLCGYLDCARHQDHDGPHEPKAQESTR